MTSLYETWLAANPKMMQNINRWKLFIEAHPEIQDNPTARYAEFENHQRIHFPELWKLQSSNQKIVPFSDKFLEKKEPRKRSRA